MKPERWQKIQDLFDRALLLTEPERGAFLLAATGGDEDLLGEVQTLLAADTESEAFFDNALSEGLDLYFENEIEAVEPARFGKYKILERIGEGGFGKVYRGHDAQLERSVAIKTCTARDPALRQRFFREARIAAGLQHPKIVTVHDFGEEENLPYLVQELLEGEDLDQPIERRDAIPMTIQQSYLLQIAQGLAYAHEKKVLHRDIKPANIRVLRGDQIKILDFGIACLVNEQQRLTREHATVGTIGYIAPEQLRGHDLDERSDIFSFGVLAYELLALQRPFQGRAFADISYQILHGEPKPLRELKPAVPSALADLIHRCLMKNPEQRYASFREVARGLAEMSDSVEPRQAAIRWGPSLYGVAALITVLAAAMLSIWIAGPKSGETASPGGIPTATVAVEASELERIPPSQILPSQTGSPQTGSPQTGSPQTGSPQTGSPQTSRAEPSKTERKPEAELRVSMPALETKAQRPSELDASASDRTVSVASNSSNVLNDEKAVELSPNQRQTPKQEQGDLEENKSAPTDSTSLQADLSGVVGDPGRPAVREEQDLSAITPPPPKSSPEPSPDLLGDPLVESTLEASRELAVVKIERAQTQPILLHRPDPRYPALAQRRGQEAQVIVAVLVDARGSVKRALVTHCSDPGLGFEESAQAAAMQASFRLLEGRAAAAEVWAELTFDFRLPRKR